MPDILTQFFECDNPDCMLRFPGSEGHPRWNRCPACRSTIHPVATVQSTVRSDNPFSTLKLLNVEAILDNIRSAWNVGSIFRTAEGTGVKIIHLCGITPTPDNAKVSKTALGAELNIPWRKSNNGVQLARQLKTSGYQLWALEDLPGAEDIFKLAPDLPLTPVALIFGNEVSGIDPGIIELCDRVISIPMVGNKQSYNVAVAFGMAVSFLLYRQSASQGSRNILPST